MRKTCRSSSKVALTHVHFQRNCNVATKLIKFLAIRFRGHFFTVLELLRAAKQRNIATVPCKHSLRMS